VIRRDRLDAEHGRVGSENARLDFSRIAQSFHTLADPPSRGANLLRHSAATHMLRRGATLQSIGAVLRHRSMETTAHYAKVDLTMLAEIAQPWPGEPTC
jgi:site-specific recombinase XerD